MTSDDGNEQDPNESDDSELRGDADEFLDIQRQLWVHLTPDESLQIYVDVVNSSDGDFGFGVTLFVGGAIVAGTLCSGSRWHNEVATQIDAANPQTGVALSVGLRHEALRYQLLGMGRALEEEPLTAAGVKHIHLTDACVFLGGTCVARDMKWRGRLASVDGWFVGTLSPA